MINADSSFKNLPIKVRIDDYPQGTPFDRKSNVAYWEILKFLEDNKIRYYLGVIPEIIDENDINFLKRLEYCKIALHGFNHGFSIWRPNSEFDNMTKEDIRGKVLEALHKLKDFVPIDVFIPPFNEFNQDLLDILNIFNFKIITGGAETIRDVDWKNLNYGNIKLIMSLDEFYTSGGNICEIIKKLSLVPENQMLTIHLPNTYIELI